MNRLLTAIPVYNGARFIRTTLECLSAQSRPPDRIVVIDNCSTDATREMVRDFSQKSSIPTELRQNETNIGHTRNLNTCLDLAPETEYLHILLADDLVKPQFFEKLLPALDRISGPALGYTNYEHIDESGALCRNQPPEKPGFATQEVPLPQFLQSQSELQTILIPAVVLKTCGKAPLCYLPMDMPQVGDCVFYAEWGAAVQHVIEVSERLCQYRIHTLQTTTKHMLDLSAWVLDEWKVMQRISAIMVETRARKWLRQQKLKTLFAARSKVKVQMMNKEFPDYARRIKASAVDIVGQLHWNIGAAAVLARDLTKGKPSRLC